MRILTTVRRPASRPRRTLTLSSAGFYNIAHEFRDGQATKNKMFP